MQGDTIINNLTYKKIYLDTALQLNFTQVNYLCALREANNKVYYIYKGNNYEDLLYDFTKNVGDTVTIYPLELSNLYSGSSFPFPKRKIDTIKTTIIEGVPRKTYIFNPSSSYGADVWYEGIGSVSGLMIPFSSILDVGEKLLCVSKNDLSIYNELPIENTQSPTPPYSCEYTIPSSTKNNTLANQLLIYPSYSSSLITIESRVLLNNLSIEIITSTGQVISKISNIKGYKYNIDVSNFANGVYFLELKQDDKKYTTKVIKN
jgi:hypothetical protein